MVLFYSGYDWPLEVGAEKILGPLAYQVRISGEALAYKSAGLRNAWTQFNVRPLSCKASHSWSLCLYSISGALTHGSEHCSVLMSPL